MTAVADYPPPDNDGDERWLVRGDTITIGVTIQVDGAPVDITGWTWKAEVRANPDDTVAVVAFDIDVDDPTNGHLIMSLADDDAALVEPGMGFDLEQLTPDHATWWISPRMRVRKDYTR